MKNLRPRLASAVSFTLVALVAAACGDSGDDGTGGGGEGGNGTQACGDGAVPTGCTVAIAPSDDDTSAIQTALIEAQSGDVVCLCGGTFAIENRLSLTTPNVTIRGAGASREDVVLDFAGQLGGDDGLTATGDGFVVENLWIKNTPGNGIVATGVEGVEFKNLKVSWDAGSVTENGAYAVYPVKCTNVLVESCEIVGAADAGVYVGQSNFAIVRDNDVHANVAGIEIENTTNSEVYDNLAYDNTAGILVFNLPNLEKKDGAFANVHDNLVYENNRENFGEDGTIVAAVPPGIGALVLAADDTEFHGNQFRANLSLGIVIVSFDTIEALIGDQEDDPLTDRYAQRTYIYGNTFIDNGTDPFSPFTAVPADPLEDVFWDGIEDEAGDPAELCLSSTPPSFRNINGVGNIANGDAHSTDTTPHECDLDVQAPISF